MEQRGERRRMFLYNTVCDVTLRRWRGDSRPILDACEAIATGVQSMLNVYDPQSEIGTLNRLHRVGEPYAVSEELFGLLLRVREISEQSCGAFDPTLTPLSDLWNFTAERPAVPGGAKIACALQSVGWQHIRYDAGARTVTFQKRGMRLDLGGAGKGYAVGLVTDFLERAGVESAAVNFGGNLYLVGPCWGSDGPRDWAVGVQAPCAKAGKSAGTLRLRSRGVATSGGYDRCFVAGGTLWHHLLDPWTGYPVQSGLSGVTVVCRDALLTDLLSTALFVLGQERGAALAQRVGKHTPVDYLMMRDDGGCLVSDGLRQRFVRDKDWIQTGGNRYGGTKAGPVEYARGDRMA